MRKIRIGVSRKAIKLGVSTMFRACQRATGALLAHEYDLYLLVRPTDATRPGGDRATRRHPRIMRTRSTGGRLGLGKTAVATGYSADCVS